MTTKNINPNLTNLKKSLSKSNSPMKNIDLSDDFNFTLYDNNKSPEKEDFKIKKNRPNTAMFSVGSKISNNTNINSRPQSSFKSILNNATGILDEKQTDLKEKENKRKKMESIASGPFLNIDYDELYRLPEIKDFKVKKILEEVNGFGPYYSHCTSCNKKNLEFYSKMDSNYAVKILKNIKDKKNLN